MVVGLETQFQTEARKILQIKLIVSLIMLLKTCKEFIAKNITA